MINHSILLWLFEAWQLDLQIRNQTEVPMKEKPPNILFIAVDDLRPTLGCYGDQVAITPNLDRWARKAAVFSRAYCQQAVCNPSRASLMTGMRPDTIGVWDLSSNFREELPEQLRDLPQFCRGTHFRSKRPDVVTLPEFFKQRGYHTQSIGKIYHGSPKTEDPQSWSAPSLANMRKTEGGSFGGFYALSKNLDVDGSTGPKRDSSECADVEDAAYIDGQAAELAVKKLGELKAAQPFFLAVGFRKPHLPFCAPKKYWDLYDREKLAEPDNPYHPEGVPEVALHNNRELRGYRDIPKEGVLSPEKTAELRHGYYACVSYMDAMAGRVLDELEHLGLEENTIVSFYGDHGYHLGEKGLWCKTTNYELDTNAPLMISMPDGRTCGQRPNALVEFVDLYPTLVEAAGFEAPDGLEGLSMTPLLVDPNQSWKQAAFSQFPRPWRYHGEPEIMGYSIRTDRYRYTEWQKFRSRDPVARELYDHQCDAAEMTNLAEHPDLATVVSELSNLLRGGWRSALPVSTQ